MLCNRYNQDSISVHNVKNVQPKGNINTIKGTKGLPKALKGYGSRGIVVLLGRGSIPGGNFRSNCKNCWMFQYSLNDGISKLRKISELCTRNTKFIINDKLYNLTM
jgi:hypothetical protein